MAIKIIYKINPGDTQKKIKNIFFKNVHQCPNNETKEIIFKHFFASKIAIYHHLIIKP